MKSQSNLKLFKNGSIYIKPDTKVNNLLIQNDMVVGFNVRESIYKNAEIIDLNGGAAYPGFIDNHTHLLLSSTLKAVGIELHGASTAHEMAEILSEKIKEHPEDSSVFGHGFVLHDYSKWTLDDLKIIDQVTGSRPTMLVDQLGHSYIVNSTALSKAEITCDTPNPPGGDIIHQNGRPTGMLLENAGCLVGNTAIFPYMHKEQLHDGLAKIMNLWSSMGYTGVVEMMGGPCGQIHLPSLFKDLEKEGKLPVRVNYTYTIYGLDDIYTALENVGTDTDMVRFAGLKLFVDGAAGNGGAWTSWENTLGKHGIYAVYHDDTYGEKYNVDRMIEEADAHGLDIRYHTHGDMAIDIILNAIEAVKEKNGHISSVHTLYHLGFITDEQIERMRKLGRNIVAGLQPSLGWEYSKEITPEFYGEDKRSAYPYKKIRDAGISIGLGSDFPSNMLELTGPTINMRAALTGAGDPLNHPPLTMEDMIKGFTIGSAASTYLRDVGKLDIGYKADIVVYDKDLYYLSTDELEIDNPKVVSTWINGKKIFEA